MQLHLNLLDEHEELQFMNREWIALDADGQQIYLQCYALRDVQLDIVQMQKIGGSHSIVSTEALLAPEASYYELQLELGLPCGYVLVSLVFDKSDSALTQKSLDGFIALFKVLSELNLLPQLRLCFIEQQILQFVSQMSLSPCDDSPFYLKPVWPDALHVRLKTGKTLNIKTKQLWLIEVEDNQCGSTLEFTLNQQHHCGYDLIEHQPLLRALAQQFYACDVPSNLIENINHRIEAINEEAAV